MLDQQVKRQINRLKVRSTDQKLDKQIKRINKTEVESVQLGNTYIADMDECPQDKYVVSAMWLAQCGQRNVVSAMWLAQCG